MWRYLGFVIGSSCGVCCLFGDGKYIIGILGLLIWYFLINFLSVFIGILGYLFLIYCLFRGFPFHFLDYFIIVLRLKGGRGRGKGKFLHFVPWLFLWRRKMAGKMNYLLAIAEGYSFSMFLYLYIYF